jgi:hypothetical protein
VNSQLVDGLLQPLPIGAAVGDACAARSLAAELHMHAPTGGNPTQARLLLTAALL